MEVSRTNPTREQRDRLLGQRSEFDNRIRGLRAAIEREGRGTSAAEAEILERSERKLENIVEQIAELDAAEGRSSRPDPRRAFVSEPVTDDGNDGSNGSRMSGDQDQALRSIERLTQRSKVSGASADHMDRLVRSQGSENHGLAARYVQATADPAYRRGFFKQSDPFSMTPEEAEAVRRVRAVQADLRALDTSMTGDSFGLALPVEIDPAIQNVSNGALNPIRSLATVRTMNGPTLRLLNTQGVSAAYYAEGVASDDDSPTLADKVVTAFTGRVFVPFSVELSEDDTDLASQLMQLIVDEKDVLEATQFLSGDGTTGPEGIVTGLTGTQKVTTATALTYAVADNWALKAAIPARYITQASYLAAPSVWDTAYQQVAQADATHALTFTGGRGGQFLGADKHEWSTMDTGVTTAGDNLIIGGDIRSAYTIADRIGMSAEIVANLFDPSSGLPTNQRGLLVHWRTGAVVNAPNALRFLQVKPSS